MTLLTENGPALPQPAKPPVSNQRVLVVEDNDDLRRSMQTLLHGSLGITVDGVADGAKAMEALGTQHYSVLITDLKMPRISGMQLLHEIQTKRMNSTVIVTTGYGSIEEAVQAMQMGAYEFLTKPADPQH